MREEVGMKLVAPRDLVFMDDDDDKKPIYEVKKGESLTIKDITFFSEPGGYPGITFEEMEGTYRYELFLMDNNKAPKIDLEGTFGADIDLFLSDLSSQYNLDEEALEFLEDRIYTRMRKESKHFLVIKRDLESLLEAIL